MSKSTPKSIHTASKADSPSSQSSTTKDTSPTKQQSFSPSRPKDVSRRHVWPDRVLAAASLVIAVVTLIIMIVIANRQNTLNTTLNAQTNQLAGPNLLNISTFTKLWEHGVETGTNGSSTPWSSAKGCSNEFTWIQNQGRSDTSVTEILSEDQKTQLFTAMLNPETKQIQVSAPFTIPAGQVRIFLVDTPPSTGYASPGQNDSPVAAQCPLIPAVFVQLDGTDVRMLSVTGSPDSTGGSSAPSGQDFTSWYQRFNDACLYGIKTCPSQIS